MADPTPRRLTREESRRRTRESLLDAAADVFGRRGYHAASVDEVAEAAGFSKGAVYANFASKAELFLALLDRRLERDAERWARIGESKRQRPEAGEGEEQSFARELGEERTWNLLAVECFLDAMRDDQVRGELAARYRRIRSTLGERLDRQFTEAGGEPPLPVEHLAWLIVALGHGLAIQAYLEPEALPEDLYETAIARLLDGAAPGAEG